MVAGTNRIKFRGEEAFLISLFHLFQGLHFVRMAAVDCFGGDPRRLSTMYLWFLMWLDEHTNGLVHGDSLSRWVECFPSWSGSVKRKLESDHPVLLYDDDEMLVFGASDCNMRPTMTPGTGPADRGTDAPRHIDADLHQRAFLPVTVKKHGLKAMTTTLSNGIIGNVFGPVSIHDNDTGVMNLSGLVPYLEEIQTRYNDHTGQQQDPYKTLVDSTFHPYRVLQKRVSIPINGILTPREVIFNKAHASSRQIVELSYSLMMNEFIICQSKYHNWRLLNHVRDGNPVVALKYHALDFFGNCYVCCYGSTINSYSGIMAPTLAFYLETLYSGRE